MCVCVLYAMPSEPCRTNVSSAKTYNLLIEQNKLLKNTFCSSLICISVCWTLAYTAPEESALHTLALQVDVSSHGSECVLFSQT